MKMPVLFIGHGSPMLLVEDNPWTKNWYNIAQNIPKPKAILCISAHWESAHSAVIAHAKPELIYDFYGFPPPLYTQQYPVSGSPELARRVQQLWLPENVLIEEERGFDHGSWAVLKHMYPQADVPMIQLSLNRRLSPQAHIDLAKRLRPLREEGVLILGSGNIVHNLRMIDWQAMNQRDYGFDWARSAQAKILTLAHGDEWEKLADYSRLGDDVANAIPSPEHFLPLLYVLAQRSQDDDFNVFNNEFVGGSLDMACVHLGKIH